jgi:hypothetical protein
LCADSPADVSCHGGAFDPAIHFTACATFADLPNAGTAWMARIRWRYAPEAGHDEGGNESKFRSLR